jgi:hypothetical protein
MNLRHFKPSPLYIPLMALALWAAIGIVVCVMMGGR